MKINNIFATAKILLGSPSIAFLWGLGLDNAE